MTSDREHIIERLIDLATALDQRDWTSLEKIFTESAHAYSATGSAEIVAMVRTFLGGCGPSHHQLSNHRVEVQGNLATSRTYVRAHHQSADRDTERNYECFGEYVDHWTQTDSRWKLASRTFTVSHEVGDRGILQPG